MHIDDGKIVEHSHPDPHFSYALGNLALALVVESFIPSDTIDIIYGDTVSPTASKDYSGLYD